MPPVNLAEALDELATNVLRDRSAIVSGPNDQLWSDETLVRYINDAYFRFARQSLCLRDDATPAVTQVELDTDTRRYELHPAVVAVISARYDTDTNDLPRIGRLGLPGQPMLDAPFQGWDPSASVSTPGRPRAYWTDEGVVMKDTARALLMLDNTPTAAEAGLIIQMRVCRVPLEQLTLDDLDAKILIPEEYHFDMLDWAAYRALRNHDADTELRQKADSHKDAFEATVQRVKVEMLRKMFAPLGWGFGRNGFTWSGNNG